MKFCKSLALDRSEQTHPWRLGRTSDLSISSIPTNPLPDSIFRLTLSGRSIIFTEVLLPSWALIPGITIRIRVNNGQPFIFTIPVNISFEALSALRSRLQMNAGGYYTLNSDNSGNTHFTVLTETLTPNSPVLLEFTPDPGDPDNLFPQETMRFYTAQNTINTNSNSATQPPKRPTTANPEKDPEEAPESKVPSKKIKAGGEAQNHPTVRVTSTGFTRLVIKVNGQLIEYYVQAQDTYTAATINANIIYDSRGIPQWSPTGAYFSGEAAPGSNVIVLYTPAPLPRTSNSRDSIQIRSLGLPTTHDFSRRNTPNAPSTGTNAVVVECADCNTQYQVGQMVTLKTDSGNLRVRIRDSELALLLQQTQPVPGSRYNAIAFPLNTVDIQTVGYNNAPNAFYDGTAHKDTDGKWIVTLTLNENEGL